jgi:hypothetical protein
LSYLLNRLERRELICASHLRFDVGPEEPESGKGNGKL